MTGDHAAGQYNLRIQNASIEDDAEFQCQVGPAKNEQPLRTSANLTVICEYFQDFIGILNLHSWRRTLNPFSQEGENFSNISVDLQRVHYIAHPRTLSNFVDYITYIHNRLI